MKTYKIKTIEELLEIVNEKNIERFKKDFCNWLDFKTELRNLNSFSVDSGEAVLNWTDDGKSDVNIKII